MKTLPLFLKLEDRRVVLVGGGEAAAPKLRLLLKTPAHIDVVIPSGSRLFPGDLADHERVTVYRRAVRATDFEGAAIAYVATGNAVEDDRIAALSRSAGVPVNVVDRLELSDFITPAIVDREPLTVAISSAGDAPVLARRLRAMIEAMLPADFGRLARLAGGFRGTAKRLIPDAAARRRFWDRFFDMRTAQDLLSTSETEARKRLIRLANHAGDSQDGRVILVGAGPGDPDLLTIKAHRALQQADLIVYDRLIGPSILEYARRDAERIFVGKERGHHSVAQSQINRLLIDNARAGRLVVRLKGGDPFVFGRAGEEIAELRAAGVECDIIPGVTAAAGCAASAQIPLTHRDHAHAVTLVTGQLRAGEAQTWSEYAGPGRTLAVYMGLNRAEDISAQLIDGGLDPATPVAIIERGTGSGERRLYTTLSGLPGTVDNHAVESPALIIIGTVSRLAKDWPRDADFSPLSDADPHLRKEAVNG